MSKKEVIAILVVLILLWGAYMSHKNKSVTENTAPIATTTIPTF